MKQSHTTDPCPSIWGRWQLFQLIMTWYLGILVAFATVQAAEKDISDTQHVLVLHSYHQGFSWTDRVQEGIEDKFQNAKIQTELHVEYLDAKRVPLEVTKEKWIELFQAKYETTRFDVIIASDDDAYDFLKSHRTSLFPNVPVVLCGLDEASTNLKHLDMMEDYTAVIEKKDVSSTVDFILNLLPATETVYFVYDPTTSGRIHKSLAQRIESQYADRVQFRYIGGKEHTKDQLLEKVRNLPKNSALYFLGFNRDTSGKYFEPKTFIPELAKASNAPMFTFTRAYFYDGVVGGKLFGGVKHGASNAELALKILKGEPVENIEVKVDTSNQYVVDQKQLEKFSINQNRLPDNTLIYNGEKSLWSEYRHELIAAGLLFLLMAGVTAVLAFMCRRLRKIKEYLHEEKEKAQAAARTKSTFLAIMSHEIRTPMNAILGMNELMLITDLNQEQKEYADTIRTSGQTLIALINDILDFSKIEADRMEFEMLDFSVEDCIQEVFDMLFEKARSKKIHLSCIIDPDVPAIIRGDAMHLRQILLNLLSNGVKFTPTHGHVSLHCSGELLAQDKFQLKIAIKDDGIGIREEDVEKIFDPFVQADSSITREYGGTGLGLAVSRKLALNLGGALTCQSNSDKGSCFYLELPLLTSEIKDKVFEREDSHGLNEKNLLLIEPNSDDAEMLKNQSREWGMKVEHASDPDQVLQQDMLNRIDIVFVGLVPNGGSWNKLMELIVQSAQNAIPVLVGYSSADERSDIPSDSVVQCLRKPIKHAQLLNGFGEALKALQESEKNVDTEGVQVKELPQIFSNGSYQSLSILLVEDEPVNTRVIGNMLRKFGASHDAVTNGNDCLEACKKNKYDLVLMDVHMPEMGGIETTKKLLEMTHQNSHTPKIIGLSADADSQQKEKALNAGMSDYLTKPVEVRSLKNAFDWVLQHSS